MKQKTIQTKKMNYWLHTMNNGFIFFQSEDEIATYVINNMISENDTAVGEEALDHYKLLKNHALILEYINKGHIIHPKYLYRKEKATYVVSHYIFEKVRIMKQKQRNITRKHTKCWHFRRMKTLQEKKMYEAYLFDAKELRENYGCTLSSVRNGRNLTDYYDDLVFCSMNNWKSNSKKRKQWA